MTTEQLREIDARVAEHVFGWQWVQAPQWDYDGPLPEQGKVLCPPDLSKDYVWPPKGVIKPYFFLRAHYTTDPEASKQLREKLAEQFTYVRIDICTFGGVRSYQAKAWNPATWEKAFKAEAETEEIAAALCALDAYNVELPQ